MSPSSSIPLDSHSPLVVRTIGDARAALAAARAQPGTIGLVPTMGALHEGHLSLVRTAKEKCDFTVVTIFVNPAQFGPHEDLDRYPRDLAADLQQLAALDVDLVFAPDQAEMYPEGFTTYVEPPAVANSLEGACRPGHFRGVTTVVLKLFNIMQVDTAFFGQKDYQQSLVIRHMVRDLNLPIAIEVCPIVREPDGLALSSRNAYLSETERQRALSLSRSLEQAKALIDAGEQEAAAIRRQMHCVLKEAGITRVNYAEVADPESLEPVQTIEGRVVALVAAHVGQTRLIDNLLIG